MQHPSCLGSLIMEHHPISQQPIQPQAPTSPHNMRWRLASAALKAYLSTAALLIVSSMMITVAALDAGFEPVAPVSLVAESPQEILAQPNSQVRLECKLPRTGTSQSRSYYWNFVGGYQRKPNMLCFEAKCPHETQLGFQLDFDRETGAYDLVFNNVTYDLNDGSYYCDYKDTEPSTKQDFSREYRLTVLIPPQAPSISPVAQTVAREGQEYQLSCQTQGGNPEPSISWFRSGQLISAADTGAQQVRISQRSHANGTTISTLTWAPTSDDNQLVYKCQVWNKAIGQPLEREFRLEVEYAPRINVGPFNPVKVLVGQSVTLPCQVDANPPVKGVRWLKDGHLVGNQYNYTIHEIKISDAGIYSCQADNSIASIFGSTLAGLQGQVVGSVPSSGFLSFFNHIVGNHQSDASGAKSGTAVETQLQLQVLYAPRVTVKPSKSQPLQLDDYFALNCSADAWPPAHEFVWTKQDDPSFRRVMLNQPLLEFASVSATDMGNYTCTAYNRLEPTPSQRSGDPLQVGQVIERQASASAMVYVRHRPGMAEIVAGQSGETELNAKTLIQCRAKPPGYPDPTYKFWKFVGQSQTKNSLKHNGGSTYTIYSAKPEDEARYACMAINEQGQSSESETDLIVNEAPVIIPDTSARRDEDARPVGETSYSITFRGSGKPEPKVTWYHRSPIDGRRIDLSTMPARFHIENMVKPDLLSGGPQQHGYSARPKFNVVSTLNFRAPLEVSDRGQYSVEFSNNLSTSASKEFQLHIYHPPQPVARHNQPLTSVLQQPLGSTGSQSSYRIKAGFDLGETVNLTCRVSAYPRPEFEWYNPGATDSDKAIDNNSRYRIQTTNLRDDIWESTLSFAQANERDYGEYMCVSANQDSQFRTSESLRILISLSHKAPPEPPTQLEALDASSDSVTLQWVPGFDGGLSQVQYSVQYGPDDGSGGLAQRYAHLEPSMPIQDQYSRVFDCFTMNPCTVGQLAPRQAYLFRLRAKNELGYSEFSEELRASTRSNLSSIPRIVEAFFDTKNSKLSYRIEPNSDYLLTSLEARVDVRLPQQQQVLAGLDSVRASADPTTLQTVDWRREASFQVINELGDALLNINGEPQQMRISLCSRLNASLCGPEYLVGMGSASGSFLYQQRGLSLSILASSLALIAVLAALATSLHSCCLGRKDKKTTGSMERVNGSIDNKLISESLPNGQQPGNLLSNGKNSHGSTTSTNSTLAGGQQHHQAALQSIDSINGAINNGSSSDHSSDHSRQAKLDSMLPPNYNHYADRATAMMEHQHQQQQHQEPHQQGLMYDKLASPFGLASTGNGLLGLEQQQQQLSSPLNTSHFGYAASSQLDTQQQPQALMMMPGGMEAMDVGQQQHQPHLWTTHQLDDYNNYNSLVGYATTPHLQQQQQQQPEMIDPTYGTSSGLMIPIHDTGSLADHQLNGTTSYLGAYSAAQESIQQYQQQRAKYQQEMAVAQQQLYGTLARGSYSQQAPNPVTAMDGLGGDSSSLTSGQLQQLQPPILDQQQQQLYSDNNGLMQTSQMASLQVGNQSVQESDYGTTGARVGRLIREIIV